MTDTNQTPRSSVMPEILNSAAFSNRWRENFLNIVLRVAAVFGGVMFLYALFHGDYRILVIYGLIFAILLLVTLAPISYSIRAGVFSALVYLIGAAILLGYGISADASMFFLAFITMTALLFDHRLGYAALALSVVTMSIVGWLALSGLFKFFEISGTTGAASDWITYGLDMSVPGAVIVLAIYFLKREFNTVLLQVRDIFQALQSEHAQLEKRVEERTSDLMKANQKVTEQARRLRVVAEVSRSAAAIPEQNRLMHLLTELISEQLGYYHIGIFLLDEHAEYAILSAANSEGGARMLAKGHRLQVGQQGIVGFVTDSGKPRIALDVDVHANFFTNPELPHTRSEMCLPLKVKDNVIGALDIQSTEAQAFTEEDYSVLSILADQVAIAIQNAKANEETRRALQEAEIASSQLTGRAWRDYSNKRPTTGYQFRGLQAEPIHGQTNDLEAGGMIEVPIQLRGQVIGNLKLNRTDENHSWSEDEVAMVQATAERVALAMENARLLEDAQRRASKEQKISDITSKIGQSINLRNVLQTAVEQLGQAIPGSDVIIQFQSDSQTTDQEK